MISAAEAYAASMSQDEVGVRRELTLIKNKIAETIIQGEYECIIPRRFILQATINVLKKLGYKIKKEGTCYKLSWK